MTAITANVIKGLLTNIDITEQHETIDIKKLKKINNYFELVYSNKKARIFIDIDCKLSEEEKSKYTEETFEAYTKQIENKLCELDDVSVMNSCKFETKPHTKISFRLTFINDYCLSLKQMKELVVYSKYTQIKEMLASIHVLLLLSDSEKLKKSKFDILNVDLTVYRSAGKMRCVNAWKEPQDKQRINKLVKGKIEDTIIHYIPETAGLLEFDESDEEEESKEESEEEEEKKEDEPVNNKVLKEIERKVLKMGNPHFDNYDPWLELCFIIHNESKGSEEGKKLFISLCEKVCTDFNKRECISKWQSSNNKPKEGLKKTMGTLNFRYTQLFPDEKKEINDAYQQQKKEFEKTVFRINSPFKFVNIKEDKTIELMNEQKLVSFAKNQKKIKTTNDKGQTKETPFINLWLEDEKQKTYNKIVFDPSTLESGKNYNFWNGFKYSNYEVKNFNEANNKFLSLLKKIINDDVNYEYVKQWIAHIIQKPHIKTKVALVFYSDTKGVGKNCLVDGIKKLLEGYTAKMNSIEDLKKTFNIHLVNKLLVSGDEICAKARGISDLLKETITRTEQNAEAKGKDATQIEDYTNWIFTTNNYNAFYIEEGDRRFNMIHCLEEQLSSENSTAYKAELENEQIMSDLFNYLRTYKMTYKIGTSSEIPLSSYKRNLQFNSKPAYIEVLYKQPNRFAQSKWTVSRFIEIVNEYCKLNHLRACPDNITIGKFLSSILKDYKKRNDCGYNYNLTNIKIYELNEILFNFDKAYFRYCHNMEEDEEPIFKEAPAKGTQSDLDLDF